MSFCACFSGNCGSYAWPHDHLLSAMIDHRSDAAQIPTGWAGVAVTRLSMAGPFMPIIGDAIAPSPRIS